jgi:hypothetical protein
VEFVVAAALKQRVLHSGGLGGVRSVFSQVSVDEGPRREVSATT